LSHKGAKNRTCGRSTGTKARTCGERQPRADLKPHLKICQRELPSTRAPRNGFENVWVALTIAVFLCIVSFAASPTDASRLYAPTSLMRWQPQPPQLAGSLETFTHLPAHETCGGVQVPAPAMHAPFMHAWPAMARVSVICAGGPPAALAAKAATTTIPIVFTSGEDPVKIGLVESYNRPGGNVTGAVSLIEGLGAKRLGLLRELVPAATLIAVLLNPNEAFDPQLNDVQEAARSIGQQIQVLIPARPSMPL
jgi:hypothetical protein